ncbi:MAG: ABC transporter permease [Actinobacteria bacterium]|nr:ABC transporter permease [Actinomycetota bacterium]
MLPRLLQRSLRHRPGRTLLVIITIVMGLALETALLNLSLDIGQKSEEQLTAFGGNVLLLPRNGAGPNAAGLPLQSQGQIPQAQLAALDGGADSNLQGYAPFIYSLATVNGHQTVMSGTVFDQAMKINPWWKISGTVPMANDQASALIGTEMAARLGLAPGDQFTLQAGQTQKVLKLAGTLSTGGSEDNQVLVDLDLGQSLAGMAGGVSVVEASVLPGSGGLDQESAALESLVPSARAKTVSQVTQGEDSLLFKVKLLMSLVTALVFIISGLTVSASLANSVSERRRDIGLMKSLGAEGRSITAIILSEVVILGAAAGPIAYLIGLAMAQVIGMSVFDTAVLPHLIVIPVVLVSALALALLSALMPVRRALAVEPAIILKGE